MFWVNECFKRMNLCMNEWTTDWKWKWEGVRAKRIEERHRNRPFSWRPTDQPTLEYIWPLRNVWGGTLNRLCGVYSVLASYRMILHMRMPLWRLWCQLYSIYGMALFLFPNSDGCQYLRLISYSEINTSYIKVIKPKYETYKYFF